MKSILITEENLPKIVSAGAPPVRVKFSYETHLGSKTNWYAIQHYVDHRGVYQPWTILPEYILRENFICDFDEMLKDWDTIYRLA